MRTAAHEGGHVIKDSKGNVISTREYVYTNKDSRKIVIQYHSAGHKKVDKARILMLDLVVYSHRESPWYERALSI